MQKGIDFFIRKDMPEDEAQEMISVIEDALERHYDKGSYTYSCGWMSDDVASAMDEDTARRDARCE